MCLDKRRSVCGMIVSGADSILSENVDRKRTRTVEEQIRGIYYLNTHECPDGYPTLFPLSVLTYACLPSTVFLILDFKF